MSDDPAETADARELTIQERLELGRKTGTGAGGGIVPFECSLQASTILTHLDQKPRRQVSKLLARGYDLNVYGYRSEKGEGFFGVMRFDHPTERKTFRPLRYLGRLRGKELYSLTALEGSQPLYGLELLMSQPCKRILITEGEKAAEAARELFPELVGMTWPGGANNARRVDASALRGKDVILWPDNDHAGRVAMRVFAARAFEAGARSVCIVDVPPEFGEKWDLADEVPPEHREAYPLRHLIETARELTIADVEISSARSGKLAKANRLLGQKPGHSKVDREAVEHALDELDPSMSRLEWLKIARCLYLAFGDQGLPIFDAWSRGSSEKYREGEPARLWSAFAATDGTFPAKSLAWLMRQARDLPREEGKNFELDREAYARAAIEEVNENHAVVTRGSKTVVISEQFDPRTERFTLTFLKKSDFIDKLIWKIPIPGDDGKASKVSIPLGKLWFASGLRRQFDNIYFAPGLMVGPRDLNTWTGFAVEPLDNPEGWSKFKEHLLNNVAQGDSDAYEYILNWLAFGVQRLGVPIGTAFVLQGAKGSGKSIIIVLYGFLFGSHTWVTSISEDIVGRFNAHLETTLLLGVEEAFAPQNRAADGTLKDLITAKTLRFEDKFFSAWRGPSHLRIIMTSNNDHVVRADGSDRRYAVFEVVHPHQHDPDARRRYFGELVEQMESGGYEAMLGELLARDISAWNPEAIPETEALWRQKRLNLSNDPVLAWYYSRLEDGIDILPGDADTGVYTWSETGTTWVPVRAVLADYADFAKRHGHRGDEQRLKNKLARFMPKGFESRARAEPGVDGTHKVKCYPFPPLPEARQLFTARTGLLFQ